MNLTQKYHGLPGLGITGKKGETGLPGGKIYFVTQKNFEAIFEFSDISITKYVYHIINNKFSNNEQVEFYLGGNENVLSTTILNRETYQYYPLYYSNETRNKHNLRNFKLEDKSSYFIIPDTSGDYPVETNDLNKSRIFFDDDPTGISTDDLNNNIPINSDVKAIIGSNHINFDMLIPEETESTVEETESENSPVIMPRTIVRDSYGNVIYSSESDEVTGNLKTTYERNNLDPVYGTDKGLFITYDISYQNIGENPDEQLVVKMPTKLRSIFNEGDIIFIKTNYLDKDTLGTDFVDDESTDSDYNMLYITDELVGATYQKILNNIVEKVFVKYPYIYNDIFDVYHINLRNVISSTCFNKNVLYNTIGETGASTQAEIDARENKYKKFIEHNKKALESLITEDDSYLFTIINTPKTDVIDNNYYEQRSDYNSEDCHNNLFALIEENDDAQTNNTLSIWYNHNYSNIEIEKITSPNNKLKSFENNVILTPADENDENEEKLKYSYKYGYFKKNQIFNVCVDGNESYSKLFIDDPYVNIDSMTNVYVRDLLYDKNLNYEYGYLPTPTSNLFRVVFKQGKQGVIQNVEITIPNSLIFKNLRSKSQYKIGYLIKYKNNGEVIRDYITNNKLTFEYTEDFVFMYFVESINKSFVKYSKPVLVEVEIKHLTEKRLLRIKNMINMNVGIYVTPIDTFDILPDELLLYTYEKILYDTTDVHLQIDVNPEIENAQISKLEIRGIQNDGEGDYIRSATNSEYYDSEAIITDFDSSSSSICKYEPVNQPKHIDILFRSNNTPTISQFKYYHNEKDQDTFYKITTSYKVNYRDYIDERILIHHNKVDLRRRPIFNLRVETDGNNLETINSYSNGIYCNKFVTYLYLDIEDFESKYWFTDDMNKNEVYLDVTLSLNNNIKTNAGDIINRAFFKSFNKENTDINVQIEDITNCKTIQEQNLKFKDPDKTNALLWRQFAYTYNNNDITTKFESGLLIVNKGNATNKDEYYIQNGSELKNKNNLDFTIKNLTYDDKHIKLRIDIELSNPVLSNIYMQWLVTDFNIHYNYGDGTGIEQTSKFDYIPLKANITASNGSAVNDYGDTICYVQTNTWGEKASYFNGAPIGEYEQKHGYILYVDNPKITKGTRGENAISPLVENDILKTDNITFEFLNDLFDRYKTDIQYDISQNNPPIPVYVVYDDGGSIEKSICKSNILNICINPIEFVAGRNDTEIDYITNRNVKFYGSDAQIQLYAGFVESDYVFNNYVDLNNYILYKKYFQDNVKAITIESTGNVMLMVKYNAALFNPISRFENTVFYYNDEELESSRYDKTHPIYFKNVNHSLTIRDEKLLKSMKAWNEVYEKTAKFKTLSFTGNISKYSNGYTLLQITSKNVPYYRTYYYNTIGRYKTEYFNKIVYNINNHQFDSKGLYTLTDTQMMNNIIVDNNELKDTLYKNVEQPLIPTMYQPLKDHYFRSLMYDIDWIYTDSTGSTNADKHYEDHFVLYPRIAFNTAYDSVNVLMLKQPVTNEKLYYYYKQNQS